MNALRVLIVDDSSVMRKIVDRSLRQAGLAIKEVFEASNGVEALARMQQTRVDLILSDINMPAMDGLELVRQLQAVENAQGVPIVMITTEAGETHVVQALSNGARGYIRKPFSPDQIKERIIPLLEEQP
ncbi:MAG TPA: response regulator [Terriglobia bacterium]|nr:response regulator [Terriglobia bacterium]